MNGQDAEQGQLHGEGARGTAILTQYGFGWRITGETVWHSGETVGFRNVIVRYPHRRITVIVLTNRNDPEPYRTALAIADLFRPR